MTDVAAIVAANAALIDRLPHVSRETASERCWACGYSDEEFRPEAVEVAPPFSGDSATPDDLWLLCPDCRRNKPDAVGREAQERWLASVPLYLLSIHDECAQIAEALVDYARDNDLEIELLRWLHDRAWNPPLTDIPPSTKARRSDALWSLMEEFIGAHRG